MKLDIRLIAVAGTALGLAVSSVQAHVVGAPYNYPCKPIMRETHDGQEANMSFVPDRNFGKNAIIQWYETVAGKTFNGNKTGYQLQAGKQVNISLFVTLSAADYTKYGTYPITSCSISVFDEPNAPATPRPTPTATPSPKPTRPIQKLNP